MGKDARVSRWETTTADLGIATGRGGGVGLGADVVASLMVASVALELR